MDVTKKAEVAALYDLAEKEFGRVDISMQNAGVITIARIEAMTEAEWDKVMAVNTKGVFLCCQEAIAAHPQARRGRPADQHGLRPGAAGFHLHAALRRQSKFGVVGITQSLAKEVAKEKITVNAICPGIIDTDMWAYNDAAWGKLLGDYKPGELMAEWVKNIPMGRAGSGEDVSGLVTLPRQRRRRLHHRPDHQCRWRPDHVIARNRGGVRCACPRRSTN